MTGTLFVVPTPLGNLEDITLRAVRVLNEVGLIAAEDTRRSRVLLNHLGIKTRLVSYHQHAKVSGLATPLSALETGDVALISDAGMPSIADPGFELIQAAMAAGFRVEVLPGPSAPVTAAVLAALPARGYVFMGFLPRGKQDMADRLSEVAGIPYSLVLFEAPSRVLSTLSVIGETLGDRDMVAVKELTKIHEASYRGTVSEVIRLLDVTAIRGEWTLVIGCSDSEPQAPSDEEIGNCIEQIRASGETTRDAVRLAAESLNVPRSTAYRIWLEQDRRRLPRSPE